jgi:hypothetical protein
MRRSFASGLVLRLKYCLALGATAAGVSTGEIMRRILIAQTAQTAQTARVAWNSRKLASLRERVCLRVASRTHSQRATLTRIGPVSMACGFK